MARKLGGKLNLAVWRSTFVTVKLKSANILHIYPVRMRRGKVIGRVVVVVDTKIAKSGDVRT